MNVKKSGAENGGLSDYAKRINEMKTAAGAMAKDAKDAPVAAKQQILGSLLKHVEALNSHMYTPKSWNALMKAYGKGKQLSLTDKPSLKNLNRAISELTAALSALRQAKDSEEEDETREGLPMILDLKQGKTQQADNTGGAQEAAEPAASSEAAAVSGGVDISL